MASDREERIAYEHSIFSEPHWQCDPVIAQAVLAGKDSFHPKDSWYATQDKGVNGRSIKAKVQKHLDPAFLEFTQRQGFAPSDWRVPSDLVGLAPGQYSLMIEAWGRGLLRHCGLFVGHWHGAASGDPDCEYQDVRLQTTIDALLAFHELCYAYQPTRVPVRVCSTMLDEELGYDEQRINRRQVHPLELRLKFAYYEDVCELCCAPTQLAAQKAVFVKQGKMLAHERLVSEDPRKPKPGRLVQQGPTPKIFSDRFCDVHTSKKGYARDAPRRERFYAVIRLLVEGQAARRLTFGLRPMHEIQMVRRAMAHAIVMTPKQVPRAVNAWCTYLMGLPDNRHLRISPQREQVLAFYDQVIAQALRLGVIAVKDRADEEQA